MREKFPETIAEAASRIQSRELSPVDLVREFLRRIATYDPVIHAFITVTADEAMAQAHRAEKEIRQGHYRGALHGIPFSLKDNFFTAGVLTTGHSKIYADTVPTVNATAAERLFAAGAILIGKNSMHELAHGGPSFDLPWPPAQNPWNLSCFTAGSSSGSAAAVAAGMALGALGTDTGGSIVNPAALCGLVGFKPTFGLVSRYGVIPNCFSLDHCGPIARTVEDCAILMNVIAGHDPKDRSSITGSPCDFRAGLRTDLQGVRVGVVRRFGDEDSASNEEVRNATEDTIRLLEDLGARPRDVRLRSLHEYYDVWTIIEAPETFEIQRQALMERTDDFGSVFLTRTLIACLIDAADYVAAQMERTAIIKEIGSLFADCDVLICPGAGPAPVLDPGLALWPKPNRSVPFTLTGFPMIAVPAGLTETGLPLSVQFVGKPHEDAKLLGIAHAYERASGWTLRRAPSASPVPPPLSFPAPTAPSGAVSQNIAELCQEAANRAGLCLSERAFALLCEAAPEMQKMISRVRVKRRSSVEPANVFIAPERSTI